jgi:hypothetical protein
MDVKADKLESEVDVRCSHTHTNRLPDSFFAEALTR